MFLGDCGVIKEVILVHLSLLLQLEEDIDDDVHATEN